MEAQVYPVTASDSYSRIYALLAELREVFHRSGRLDDSNAKLDEVSKLFAMYLAFKRKQIDSFPEAESKEVIRALREAFNATVQLDQYQLKDGGSIFGPDAGLALREGDEDVARHLIRLVRECIDSAFAKRAERSPFDVLNEAFGHFVRDNFRGNIEDAQYMTPPEVVEFVVDLALTDLARDAVVAGRSTPIVVLDPCCGVGSFLTTFYNATKESSSISSERLRLYGQDKVERMVRLSTINMELFDVGEHHIYIGNSLAKGSQLDELNGAVDLILTNPPFGARFGPNEIKERFGSNTPFFSSLKRQGAATIDSELLFVDRNLQLLRDGGRLLIVLPDGVVSAKGLSALLRQHLAKTATLLGVVELPATAFAQAGTRTKTAVMYLQKGGRDTGGKVFMATAKDLGFQVSSRKGVQVKVAEGLNELPAILTAYKSATDQKLQQSIVLSRLPSCVLVQEGEVKRGSWTPNHFSATRIETVLRLQRVADFDLVPLGELAEFCADKRRAEAWQDGYGFISVLHILGDGLVDVAGAMSNAPKTPGVLTNPGEVLMSRINPRIPRVCVTPDLGMKTLCSSEFEVMRCVKGVDPHGLAFLLQSQVVQNQIQSLTSGTSASHNRVRSSDLATVLVPIARKGSVRADRFNEVLASYRTASTALMESSLRLVMLRSAEPELFQ